jgi:hypothetical protein
LKGKAGRRVLRRKPKAGRRAELEGRLETQVESQLEGEAERLSGRRKSDAELEGRAGRRVADEIRRKLEGRAGWPGWTFERGRKSQITWKARLEKRELKSWNWKTERRRKSTIG